MFFGRQYVDLNMIIRLKSLMVRADEEFLIEGLGFSGSKSGVPCFSGNYFSYNCYIYFQIVSLFFPSLQTDNQ